MNKSIRNKTIFYNEDLKNKFEKNILVYNKKISFNNMINKTILSNSLNVLKKIPNKKIDLIIIDAPYNLNKKYGDSFFQKKSEKDYIEFLKPFIVECYRVLKDTGSLFFCYHWQDTKLAYKLLDNLFIIKNNIVWKRDKGRSCKRNFKNNYENILFVVKTKKYKFFSENVKVLKKVKAPYIDKKTKEKKDWFENKYGEKYRKTGISNIWTDLIVPFWSMPENTEHATQKSEKLIERIILSTTEKKDIILDPFLGAGTTSVVAKKLNRKYIGIDNVKKYCIISEYRLNNE